VRSGAARQARDRRPLGDAIGFAFQQPGDVLLAEGQPVAGAVAMLAEHVIVDVTAGLE
jgi:hypothetical protein